MFKGICGIILAIGAALVLSYTGAPGPVCYFMGGVIGTVLTLVNT